MSDDDTSEENPLRDLIGEENFAAMSEADRLWMANTVARVEHEAVMEAISGVSIDGEQEDEEARAAEFDAHGAQVSGPKMPKGVRMLLRKILKETEDEDRDHGNIASAAAGAACASLYTGARVSASYALEQNERDGSLTRHEAVTAQIMFDEMMAVRFMEQAVYNGAHVAAVRLDGVSLGEFKEIVQAQAEKVLCRLVDASRKAAMGSVEERFEYLGDEEEL